MLITDAIALHLKRLGSENAGARTIANQRSNLRSFACFLEAIGVTDAEALAPAVVESYRSYLFESRCRGRPLSVGTQVQKLCVLNSFFETLAQAGAIAPERLGKVLLPKISRKLPPPLPTVRDVERLLVGMKTSTPLECRNRTIGEVFYATGIRQAEASGLRTTDVDFEHRALHVVGKGLKDRTLPLTRRCVDCLRDYVLRVRPLLAAGPRLFPTKSGRRMEAATLIALVRKAAVAAGITTSVATHTFRHFLATELLRNGARLRSIQEFLGHRSVETTVLYTHVLGKDLKRVHRRTHPREREYRRGRQ